MEDDDLEIDNIIDKKEPAKKKVDGHAKGGRSELELCKLLTKHFEVEFSRASGSGSRWSQVNFLPEHAKKTLTGDVCVPEGFQWVIESKAGYEDDIDLNNIFNGKPIPQIEKFIDQTTRDSSYCGRKSIICWKRKRKAWLALIQEKDLLPLTVDMFSYRMHYRDWIMVPLEELLRASQKSFWFDKENSQ